MKTQHLCRAVDPSICAHIFYTCPSVVLCRASLPFDRFRRFPEGPHTILRRKRNLWSGVSDQTAKRAGGGARWYRDCILEQGAKTRATHNQATSLEGLVLSHPCRVQKGIMGLESVESCNADTILHKRCRIDRPMSVMLSSCIFVTSSHSPRECTSVFVDGGLATNL